MTIQILGVDGDDTLWHSEGHYHVTQKRFAALLDPWVDAEAVDAALLETERRNLALFGYGVKGFTLSMIETALALTEHRIDGRRIEEIIGMGKELLAHPVELLDDVAETLGELSARHRLLLITKGDLFHQESKVAASGIGEVFEGIEIVAEKDAATYSRVLARLGAEPAAFCMVGNSIRSDIAPGAGDRRRGRAHPVPRHLGARAGRDRGGPPAHGAGQWLRPGPGRDRRPGRERVRVDWDALRREAAAMSERAYAPYSGVRVGACGLAGDGRLVRGCNVENASYGLSLCAECGLVSELAASGGGRLMAVAVVAGDGRPVAPCGRCRQLMYEHGGGELLLDADGGPLRLAELLPAAFGPDDVAARAGR